MMPSRHPCRPRRRLQRRIRIQLIDLAHGRLSYNACGSVRPVRGSNRAGRPGWLVAVVAAGILIGGCTASVTSRDGASASQVQSSEPAPNSRDAVGPRPASTATVVTTVPAIIPPATSPLPVSEPVVEPAALAYQPPTPLAVPTMQFPLEAVGQRDGEQTVRIQARLLELGFWVQASDGDYGLTTTQAIMAAQKYYGLSATGSVDEATAGVLSAATERASGTADAGTLVEIDKSKQLLFLVTEGVTSWILNASTGSEVPYEAPNEKDPLKIERGDAVTPVGLFHVNRERPDGWWKGDLGEIYRPKYFVGGIAIHGSNSIPNYPASHGCVRVSVPAMDERSSVVGDVDLLPRSCRKRRNDRRTRAARTVPKTTSAEAGSPIHAGIWSWTPNAFAHLLETGTDERDMPDETDTHNPQCGSAAPTITSNVTATTWAASAGGRRR